MSTRAAQSTGRSGGRGGRHTTNQGRNRGRNEKKLFGKRDMKFHPLGVKGSAHFGSFDEVKDNICRKLAKKKLDNPRDIIDCVINMELLDIDAIEPVRRYSAAQDPQDRADENEHLASVWSSNHKEWKYRKRDLAANLLNLHATLIEDCSEAMQEKLKHEPDYYTTLYRDPIELLKRIRKFMTTSDDADWEMFEVWEAFRKLLNTQQGKDESVPDYRRRFEANADALEDLIGKKVLFQFTRASAGYDAQPTSESKRDYIDGSWERYKANGFLYNSHRKKTQSLIDGMKQEFALKHLPFSQRNKYPMTLENAALVVERHQAIVSKDSKGKNKSKSGDGGQDGSAGNDGAGGRTPGSNFAQTGGTSRGRGSGGGRKCYVCGSEEHIAPNCNHRFRSKDEWFNPSKYRNYSALQVGADDDGEQQQATGASHIQVGEPEDQERFSPRNWSMVQVGPFDEDHVPVDYGLLFTQRIQALDLADDASLSSHTQIGQHIKSHKTYLQQRPHKVRRMEADDTDWKDLDCIDSGSNFDMACTRKVMDPGSIEELKDPFKYRANTGGRVLTHKGNVLGEERYLDENAYTNIRSIYRAVQAGHRVRFDSSINDCFYIYPRNGGAPLVYRPHPQGLWVRSLKKNLGPKQDYVGPKQNYENNDGGRFQGFQEHPSSYYESYHLNRIRGIRNDGRIPVAGAEGSNHSNNNNTLSGYSGLQTVKQNMEGFTQKQVKRANLARAGYHMAGAPDMEKFKLAIQGNFFKNCPITVEDVKNAEAIYGPSVSARKGKRRRPTAPKVVDDHIEIPRELIMRNEKLNGYLDCMFINNAIFLTWIDSAVKYRASVALKSRTKTALYEGIDTVLRDYNHATFTIRTIFCDGEFAPVFDPVKDGMGVEMNYCSPGEHEPTAERNNQALKSWFRVQYHRMPYRIIPRVLTEALGERVAETANFYPAKGGISSHYSPFTIIHRRPVDYKTEFVAETGSYVQAYGHETSRNQRSRTVDGIYLKPTRNMQEGHWILDLNTEQKIRRSKVEVFPITSQVIKKVEDMAAREGVKDLRYYNKNGDVILDADLLAGVDVDELWDQEFTLEDNESRDLPSDENLRNEYISDEELQDLKNDYEEHYGSDSDSSQSSQDETVFRKIRNRPSQSLESEEEESSEESEEESDHEQHARRDSEELEEVLENLIEEIQEEFSKPPELTIRDVLKDDEDRREDTNHGDGSDSEEESEDIDADLGQDTAEVDQDDGRSNASDPSAERLFSPRHTRSGHAYYADGIKYRPSLRADKDKPKYDRPYLRRNKPKPNSKKNRSAMRTKRRAEKIAVALHQLLDKRRKARRKKRLQDDSHEIEIDEGLYNLAFQQIGTESKQEYPVDEARLIARFMGEIKERVTREGVSFIQQHYLNKGLKIFGDSGKKAAVKELDQLVKRNCWKPSHIEDLSAEERRKATDSMMLLAEKNDKTIKGRHVFKGNETRDWLSREDTASPTASLEAILLTSVVDAYEGRDVMSADIPNAFIQTDLPAPQDGEARVVMKVTGLLVDYLIEIDPEYRDYVVFDRGKKVLYLVILKAIYGMLEASLLFYKRLRNDLEAHGFKFNPYDPCVCNKTVKGKQQTVRFHVDDLMSSHIDPKVNDEFLTWLNSTYGSIKDVTCTRGKVHTYLGMTIDYSRKGKVKIRMDDYIERMLEEFPIKFGSDDVQETPAGNTLLDVGKGRLLDDERKEVFHSFVAKCLFLSKRARLDTLLTVSVLASRVQKPNESDWKKLVRLMKYIHSTKGWHLTLSAETLRVFKWYVDASFAVHPDFKSHTGAFMSMGKGGLQVLSRKQKLNTRSSTEAELVGVDDVMTMILWTKLFMEWQEYPVDRNVLYQDNKSAILLETNGRKSAGKRSRALNIRYYFVTDQVEKGNLVIEHCPTDAMIADYFTKPLQGEKFREFRSEILGEQD